MNYWVKLVDHVKITPIHLQYDRVKHLSLDTTTETLSLSTSKLEAQIAKPIVNSNTAQVSNFFAKDVLVPTLMRPGTNVELGHMNGCVGVAHTGIDKFCMPIRVEICSSVS